MQLSEDKFNLLKKQLESNEKHRSDIYKAITKMSVIRKKLRRFIANLQSEYYKLEE